HLSHGWSDIGTCRPRRGTGHHCPLAKHKADTLRLQATRLAQVQSTCIARPALTRLRPFDHCADALQVEWLTALVAVAGPSSQSPCACVHAASEVQQPALCQPNRTSDAGKRPCYLSFCISRANLAKFSAALGEVVIHSSLSPPVTNSSPLLS